MPLKINSHFKFFEKCKNFYETVDKLTIKTIKQYSKIHNNIMVNKKQTVISKNNPRAASRIKILAPFFFVCLYIFNYFVTIV